MRFRLFIVLQNTLGLIENRKEDEKREQKKDSSRSSSLVYEFRHRVIPTRYVI